MITVSWLKHLLNDIQGFPIRKVLLCPFFLLAGLHGSFIASVHAAGGVGAVSIATGEWVPFHSQAYKFQGVVSHIIFEAFRAENIEAKFEFLPWERGYLLAKAGDRFQGAGVWGKREKRKEDFLFTDVVIMLNNVFFHSKDFEFDWKSLKDLESYTMGGVIGYVYWDGFDTDVDNNKLKVVTVKNDLAGLKMVGTRRVDVFPATLEVGMELINTRLQEFKHNLTYHPKPYKEAKYYLLIAKKAKNAEKIVKYFNSGLKTIKGSGLYDKIRQNGLNGDYRKKQ